MKLLQHSIIIVLLLLQSCFILAQSTTPNVSKIDYGYYLIRGNYTECIRTSLEGLRKNNVSEKEKGYVFLELARSYQYKIKYDSAFYYFQKAQDHFELTKDALGVTEVTIWLMEYYRSTSNLYHLQKMDLLVAKYLTQKESNLLKALYYNRKGAYLNQFYKDSTRYARKLCMKSLEMVSDDESSLGHYIRANAMVDIGFCFEREQNPSCLNWYKDAQQIWKKLGNNHYLSQVYLNLATGYYGLGLFNKALIYSDSSLHLVNKYNYIDVKLSITYLRSLIYEAKGNPKKALEELREHHSAGFFSIQLEVYQMMTAAEESFLTERKEKELQLNIAEKELTAQIAKRASLERNVVGVMAVTLFLFILLLFFIFKKINRDRKQLKIALDFNEILLKEVNHRVKNNLTFLNSMLYLKEKYVSDLEAKRILIEFQSRIKAMALVHTEMYAMKDNRGWVDFNKIIDANIQEYISIMQQKEVDLKINITGKLNLVKIDLGLSLMLILNELITNSMKHIDERFIEIDILLYVNDQRIHVSFMDSGVGITEDQFINAKGFGLRMVRLMLKQVKGEIHFIKKQIKLSIPL